MFPLTDNAHICVRHFKRGYEKLSNIRINFNKNVENCL